jgi:prolyl oligopeptidase PreP (S9A serine peptidase family)
MRKKVRECRQANKLSSVAACGWHDYKIIRISPSGNYIELSGDGWDSDMWRMIDTRTGNIVLSNDNGVEKSMWTRDRKQFIWQTYNCEIG